MTGRVRTLCDLVRVPNLLTAAADVLAGFFYTGGLLNDWDRWLPLVAASILLYAGGVTFNDVCDAKRDALERSHRPIPSGRVGRRNAGILSVALVTIGVAIAFSANIRSGFTALALTATIGLYDGALKRTAIAPITMGMCRGLNLFLGMSPAAAFFSGATLIPIGLLTLYVGSLTLFAKQEAVVDASRRPRLLLATGGCVLAFCCLLVPRAYPADVAFGARVATFLGVVVVLTVALRGVRIATPESVQQAVKTLILLLVWFDACLTWSSAGEAEGVFVASLIVPTLMLGRIFRMT